MYSNTKKRTRAFDVQRLRMMLWPELAEIVKDMKAVENAPLAEKGAAREAVKNKYSIADLPKAAKQINQELNRRQREHQKQEEARLLAEAQHEAKFQIAPWEPFVAGVIDEAQLETPQVLADMERAAALTGKTLEEVRAEWIDIARSEEVYLNNKYQVNVRRSPAIDGNPPMVHLSIKRIDKRPIRDWRDLQRIKNEIVGPSCEGIELFPAEDRLVDTANQYHLWCVSDPTFRFEIGWPTRLVDDGNHDQSGRSSKQRPVTA